MKEKRTPCPLCEEGYSCLADRSDGKKSVAEIFPEGRNIRITFVYEEAGKEKRTPVNLGMNYCPMCGRRLM